MAARTIARLAAGSLLAAAAALGPAAVSAAAAEPVAISVHLGYADVVKVQQWMPVTITVAGRGGAIDGTLVIRTLVSGRPLAPWLTTYRQRLVLGAGATKHFQAYVSQETSSASVLAEVEVGGRVLASQVAAPTRSATSLVGVVSDDATLLDELASFHPGGVSATVVHLGLDQLASSPILLRAFDAIAFDDVATAGLSAAQQSALADYAAQGGSLVLGAGPDWSRTLGGIPAALLPLSPQAVATLPSSAALGAAGPVQAVTGAIQGGDAWLVEGAQPLLLEKPVGSGQVELATFDFAQAGAGGWTGYGAVLRQLLVRTLLSQPETGNQGWIGGGLGLPPGIGGFSLYQRSGAVSGVLGSLPALDLPSFALTGALTLGYLLLVGPVNFLVLGALRRRALAWLTLPLIAVLVAAGSYGGALYLKGGSVQTNQVAILHLQGGSGHGDLESYVGVIAPTRGDYSVGLGGVELLSPISSYFGGGSSNRADIVVDLDGGDLLLPGTTAYSLRGFASEAEVDTQASLAVTLRVVGGGLAGTVTNQGSVAFTDLVLLDGDQVQRLGQLAPGASAKLQLAAPTASGNGGSVIQALSSATTAPDQQRVQLLSLLVNQLGFKGLPATPVHPLLVAFTDRPLRAVTVDGASRPGKALSALAVSVPDPELAAGPLPASLVSGRLVDTDADAASGNGPPGLEFLRNGTATFDFRPRLGAGLRLSQPAVQSTDPYSGASAGRVTAEAWDWAAAAWTPIGFQDNGLTTLPASAVDPATGAVRIRLGSDAGTFYAGGLSLVGSVG